MKKIPTILARQVACIGVLASLAATLTACSGNRVIFRPPVAERDWTVHVGPQALCPGDRLFINWNIGDVCPLDTNCTPYYPTVNISSSVPGMFPATVRFHSYIMQLAGDVAVPNAEPINVSVNSTTATTWHRHGRLALVGTPPLSTTINPINVEDSPVIHFSSYCNGNRPAWQPYPTSIPHERSARVRLRQICNNVDLMRSVEFTLYFTDGTSSRPFTLLPGECSNLSEDPLSIREIQARSLEASDWLSCRTSSDIGPPSPIRARITMDCSG